MSKLEEFTQSPAVQILVPNHNKEKFLEYCLDSCLSQNYLNTRILVADSSTDSSREILEGYQAKANNISFVHKNGPWRLAEKLNFLANIADDDFIFILYSDEALKPSAIESLMEFMRANDLDIAYSDVDLIDDANNVTHKDYYMGKYSSGTRIHSGDINKYFECGEGFPYSVNPVSFLAKKSALKKMGGWIEAYAQEDIPFQVKVNVFKLKVGFLSKSLTEHRLYPKEISSNDIHSQSKVEYAMFRSKALRIAEESGQLNSSSKKIVRKELLSYDYYLGIRQSKGRLLKFLNGVKFTLLFFGPTLTAHRMKGARVRYSIHGHIFEFLITMKNIVVKNYFRTFRKIKL